MQKMVQLIGLRMKKLEQVIKQELKEKKAATIHVMHKSELNQLNDGAEETTSSDEDEMTEEEIIARRKAKRG